MLNIFDKVKTSHGTGIISAINFDTQVYDVDLDCKIDEDGYFRLTEDGRVRTLDGFELDSVRQTYPAKLIRKIDG